MATATRSKRIVPRRLPQSAADSGRRILLFGDSHAHAVQRAIAKREGKGKGSRVVAYRLLKDKKGVQVGDSSLEQFLERIRDAGPDELVASMIGGNQHAVYSTIQHPQPFDFFNLDRDPVDPAVGEIIPYRALKDVFTYGLRSGDGRSLEALRKATKARIVHIIPPPPKADNAHITKYHETLFANDIVHRGVSPPTLRLKFWKLQTRVLKRICDDLGIEILMPPKRAVDELGFLRPEFYAHDATHGNWLYGERVLRQLEKIHPVAPAAREVQ